MPHATPQHEPTKQTNIKSTPHLLFYCCIGESRRRRGGVALRGESLSLSHFIFKLSA